MLFVLRELAAAGELALAGLAHLNHHVRLAASDDDEAFCRALAARLGLPATIAHADVPALAHEHRQSIEVAGRHARHRALAQAAAQMGADRIATAHTRDDQAETVLLHLMRGAGMSGARGIEPASGSFIRPVLACTREELRAWLVSLGETWCEDATNADITNPRNRVRHAVLPALREHFNPAVDAALARFADILREDHAHLTAQADEAARQLISPLPNSLPRRSAAEAGLAIDAEGLRLLPRALARRVARIALETARPRRSYDLEEVDAVIDACGEGDAPGARRDLPGVRMERSGRFVVLLDRRPARAVDGFQYELPVPGRVSIDESNLVVEAEGPFDLSTLRRAQGSPSALATPDASGLKWPLQEPDCVTIRADELDARLMVRNRRAGDRLRLSRVGHKKLQDLFVDRKVDRFERDRVPIVTDRAGRIVWVAGHAVAEEFQVSALTNTVVTLKLRPL